MQPLLGRFEPRLEPVTVPALRPDQNSPSGLNEQNTQVAVAAFLEGSIRFDQIPRLIEDVLAASNSGKLESIREVLDADAEARRSAKQRVGALRKTARPRATSFA